MNESRDEAVTGDVSIFRSPGEACRYLEHWWVENGEGFAFTASGDQVVFGVDEQKNVVFLARVPRPDGGELVLRWLRDTAFSLLEARSARARKRKVILTRAEEEGIVPASLEGLLAYVGFTA